MTEAAPTTLVLAALAMGCGGRNSMEGVADASSEGAAPGHCAARLSGDGPFAALLSAPATFSINPMPDHWPPDFAPRTQELTLTAYFPGGRRPGERVLLAAASQDPRPGLSIGQPATLDDGGTATKLEGPVSSGTFTGALLGPDDGLAGDVFARLDPGDTDVAVVGRATVKLCPTGAPPPPTLSASDAQFGPTSSLRFVPAAPLDESGLRALQVRAGGRLIPTQARYEAGAVLITATSAFPPNLPLLIDTGGLTDVIGRTVSISPPPSPLVVQADLSDLGFATPPPPGAVATTPIDPGNFQVQDGRLALGTPQSGPDPFVTAGPVRLTALAGLGDPGPKSQARVRYRLLCALGPPSVVFTSLYLVANDGASAAVPLACGSEFADGVATLPAPGRLFLSIVMDQPAPRVPPFGGRDSNRLEIDAITFE